MFITSTFSVRRSRSLWSYFCAPAILPSILRTISCINAILGILVLFDTMIDSLISWMLFDVWTSLIGIMSWYDPTVDLKANVGHWPIFHGPVVLYLEDNLMYDYHSLGLCDLYFIVLWYCPLTIWCLSVIFIHDDTVWPKLPSESKYKLAWPIFHGLVILLNIF